VVGQYSNKDADKSGLAGLDWASNRQNKREGEFKCCQAIDVH
jgi:hypothetical protein